MLAVDTRMRILESAIATFAEVGYSGASARLICRRAGVNTALMNYHWGSKDKLWQAACSHCTEQVTQLVFGAIRMPPVPEQVLEDVLGALFDSFVEDPAPIRLMAWAILQADSLDFEGTAETFKPLRDQLHAFVLPLQEAGVFGDLDVLLVLTHLQAILIHTFIDQPGHRWAFGKDVSDPEHAARAKAALIRSARALLGVKKS